VLSLLLVTKQSTPPTVEGDETPFKHAKELVLIYRGLSMWPGEVP